MRDRAPRRVTVLLVVACAATVANVGCSGFSFSSKSATGETAPSTYTIQGTITPNADGTSATVALSGPANKTVLADNLGNYSFDNLAAGIYTVTPSKAGFNFSPSSRSATVNSANVMGLNFFAIKAGSTTFTLSGTISPAAAGVGVAVALSGTVSTSTVADSGGNYSFTGLPGGSYTVTPSKSGYSFSPASQNETLSASNVTGVNFTGSSTNLTTFSISGTISPSAAGGDATLVLSGARSATTTADGEGNYTFTGLGSGNYTITPSKSGYSFSPASKNETLSASNVTGANFTGSSTNPTTFSISGTITPVAGGSGATVSLSGAASATTTVDSSGNYTFTGLNNGSYTVTPGKSGYSFTPASQNAAITTADVAGLNFTDSQLSSNTVNIYPGDNIPSIVESSPAGTTFIIYPGTYRLAQPIVPKANDSFIGETACSPPNVSCPAIISGSTIIGPLATFNGTNYVVTGQTQHNSVFQTPAVCTPGWLACNIPEDLWFDGVPLQHLYASALPTIQSGQWWFDYANHTIYFHDNPAGHLVETSVVPHAAIGPASYVTFQYLTIEEFAVPLMEGGLWPSLGQSSDQYRQANGLNWIIENCEMWGHHSMPINVNYGTQVLNNYLHDNGEFGVGGGAAPDNNMVPSDVLVQGNLITHNNYANVLPMWGAGGIKFGRTHAAVIRNNTITDNDGAGIHFDASSSSPVIAGNTVTGNTDGDGIVYEISWVSALIYNNVLQHNGAPGVANSFPGYQIDSSTSTGVNAFCNVMEVGAVSGEEAWVVNASDRGYDAYPPGNYYASVGNNIHHNTVIWDGNANGTAGFMQSDAANQPHFFVNNTPPDFNSYHLANASTANFVYDDNDSQNNSRVGFLQFQSNGADVDGTVDTNYADGFPSVAITSPADESGVAGSLTVLASASDPSGIGKVEFYVDWTLQSTATSPPYQFNWTNGTSGAHTVAAMAYSGAGVRACSAVNVTKQ